MNIGFCYHPTTIVLVDDSEDFVSAIELPLKKTRCCRSYTDPLKALAFFENDYEPAPFTQRCFISPLEEKVDHLFFNVDLRQIHQEIQRADRFKEVAVVVIDYTMPGLDGLELSRKLRQRYPDIRIILLTGEADHELAINAFNEGIIDKFIKKSTPDLANVLMSVIRTLEHSYFNQLSQTIFNKMKGEQDTLSRLSDPAFIELFNSLCQNQNIVEYYLVDSNGSYLLVDEKANPYWLALLDEEEFAEFYTTANREKAPPSVTNALKNKQKLPFFYSDDDLQTLPADWDEFLHPASLLTGKVNYYYALIKGPGIYDWPSASIISYQRYLTGNR